MRLLFLHASDVDGADEGTIDIVDYVEPIMLIVGSRGLGHLKG